MSEDNEYDWGTKKQKYYSMNKREDNEEDNDSDFIEEEKEAIRLQKLRLEKIKKAKLLNEDEEESEEEETKEKKKKKETETKKDEMKKNDVSLKTIEIDNKKIIENINLLKNCLEEFQTTDDEIKILEEDNKMNLPKTISYLKEFKKMNILYSANILFNIISTLNNKMTGHHPSIKNSALFNYLLTKNAENNEQIQNNIEQILLSMENKDKENENNEGKNEEEELEEENEENEEEEDFEEEEESKKNMKEDKKEKEENEEEEENDDDLDNLKKNENEKAQKNKEKNNSISVKKPSFLTKKKRREKSEKEIDMKDNENFDSEEEKYKDEEDEDDEDEGSFIKDQYKTFNKLKKEKELLDKKRNENEKKEIEMKNDFAIRKANKEVLQARGIYRKRKKYQGNAKLMNREKFYKKEKERRKLVKQYEGKPDVYMGEATGIRRDLIRSTKIH